MWEWKGPAHEVNRPRRRGNSRDEIDPEKGKHPLVGFPFLQRDARGTSVWRGHWLTDGVATSARALTFPSCFDTAPVIQNLYLRVEKENVPLVAHLVHRLLRKLRCSLSRR